MVLYKVPVPAEKSTAMPGMFQKQEQIVTLWADVYGRISQSTASFLLAPSASVLYIQHIIEMHLLLNSKW